MTICSETNDKTTRDYKTTRKVKAQEENNLTWQVHGNQTFFSYAHELFVYLHPLSKRASSKDFPECNMHFQHTDSSIITAQPHGATFVIINSLKCFL